MHFIGNRAIVLGEGEADVQAMYNVAFTGTSFVLPVVVLLFAFYAVGVEEKAGYIRILIGGLLTGSSVCGMHYIGQLGISNYRCSYHVANVVGSAVIAIFSSTAALGIFFRWRASWTDSWWRRGICACLLAGAVSGMHWTAAVGTIYRDHRMIMKGTQLSRSQVVIVCTVLVCLKFLPRYGKLETDSSLGLCCMCGVVDVRYYRWAKSQKVDDTCPSACSRLCLF